MTDHMVTICRNTYNFIIYYHYLFMLLFKKKILISCNHDLEY